VLHETLCDFEWSVSEMYTMQHNINSSCRSGYTHCGHGANEGAGVLHTAALHPHDKAEYDRLAFSIARDWFYVQNHLLARTLQR
jgi:hypothetical protein